MSSTVCFNLDRSRILSSGYGLRDGTTDIIEAFVEDNATMSSIRYFENHVSYFVQNRKDPIKLISVLQISVSIALKYIINNSVLK